MRLCIWLATVVCCLAVPADAMAQSASSRQPSEKLIAPPAPTPEETKLLELINAARMNPDDGPEPAAQPLVFDPALMRGARNHSYYQTLHGMTHSQEPGREGFTGVDPWDRVPGCSGENCYSGGLSAGGVHNAWMNSAAHRANCLNTEHRLVGLAFDSRGHDVATAKFSGSEQRYLGGVAYCDLNGNGAYDVNEGMRGAVLRYNGQAFHVCPSGAYAIPIGSTAGEITIEIGAMSGSKSIPAGTQNYKLDFVPSAGETESLQTLWADQERLIEAITTAPIESAEALSQELSDTYGNTRMRSWFVQAQNCLEMRKTYMQIATLYQQENPPSERTMKSIFSRLRRMQQRNSWLATNACGMLIGESFRELGQNGTINETLLLSDPSLALEVAEDATEELSGGGIENSSEVSPEVASPEEEPQYYFGPNDEL